MIIKKIKEYREFPINIVWSAMFLTILGLVVLRSISQHSNGNFFQNPFLKQVLFLGPAIILCIIVYYTPRFLIHKYAYNVYVFGIFIILLPFFGDPQAGTFRWLDLGLPFSVQPSEFAKIFTIIALARYLSKYKQYFGKGYPEGIASGSAANNSSIGGALVPATVFGIPGDSLTAIIIGVLFMKGLNPGPMVFILKADLINAVFLSFLIANIAIIPLGYLAIRFFKYILQIPKAVLMPLVLSACIVGSFSVDNTTFAVTTMLFAGILGFLMEENGFPLAPSILGLVLGPMVESNFLTSLLKSNGSFIAFFERPLSMGLALVTILIWVIAVSYSIISQKKSNHKGKSNSDDSK